jgi:hypothetical protein
MEEEAQRHATVAKVQIETQIEADVAKCHEQRLYPLDFNMKSVMDVCVNHDGMIDSYLEHIHTDLHDLSGENLYEQMVKCIKLPLATVMVTVSKETKTWTMMTDISQIARY